MTTSTLGVPDVILYHGGYQASSSAPTDALPLPLATLLQPTRPLSLAESSLPLCKALDQSALSFSERSHIRLENLQSAGRISRILQQPFLPTKISSKCMKETVHGRNSTVFCIYAVLSMYDEV